MARAASSETPLAAVRGGPQGLLPPYPLHPVAEAGAVDGKGQEGDPKAPGLLAPGGGGPHPRHLRKDPRQELRRVAVLEPQGGVGVAGKGLGMAFREAVPPEALHHAPHLLRPLPHQAQGALEAP